MQTAEPTENDMISNVATNGSYEPNEPPEADVEDEPLAPDTENTENTENTPENTEYLFIFILLLTISFIYILSTGVEVAGIEKIIATHPHYVNMLLATIYSLLAVVFLLAHKTDEKSSFKTAVSLVIAVIVITFWVLNYKKYSRRMIIRD